ncbi:MAG: hypothetical protein LBL85_00125 [Methanocalculaceae archaeon]|nr:hypothetical protein [Methanocalculaceae archaeon]
MTAQVRSIFSRLFGTGVDEIFGFLPLFHTGLEAGVTVLLGIIIGKNPS